MTSVPRRMAACRVLRWGYVRLHNRMPRFLSQLALEEFY